MSLARTVILLVLASTLAGCASLDLGRYRALEIDATASGTDWHGLPLATGQIIVTEHPGATALFLSLTAERFEPYVHVGLIVFEEGEPWVYDAMGIGLPMPWAQPNAHVRGGVRRLPLKNFLARRGIVAVYAPPAGVDAQAVARFAQAREAEGFPFDSHYDASDASRYYCAEFVARALESAGAQPFEPIPVTRNPSVRVALDWLDIDTRGLLLAGGLVDESRRVALMSADFTVTEIERYFVLKRELHRRFTDDQRLGNLLYWRWQRLRLRPQVDAFYDRGVAESTDPARLADEMFGAMNGDRGAQLAEAR